MEIKEPVKEEVEIQGLEPAKNQDKDVQAKIAQAIADFMPERLKKEEEKKDELPKTEVKEEVKKEEIKVEEKKEEDRFSSKFADLARKDRSLREREKRIEEKEKKANEILSLAEKAKDDPESFLKAGNLDYDYLTNYLLNDKKPPESARVDKLGDEVKMIREELRQSRMSEEQLRFQSTESKFLSDMAQVAKEKMDDLPLVNLDEEGIPLAYEVIKAYYKENGEILPMEKALEEAEKYLSDKAEKKLEKYRTVGRFSKYFEPDKSSEKQDPKFSQQVQAKTLTNQPSASIPTKGNGRMSEADRLRYAASLIKTI